ncbi:hypothetical protein Y032_0045g1287 [Ancylostoma ceylanicum]|uniref:Uncharacterized protein n=1 Tax=Ancylostoma ceylanicum TaxID=53326 RepID=A0A016UE62_9BILA|nr:hypothetical protein Y032_0045g1287 [Ancylostoma ceylanicum]
MTTAGDEHLTISDFNRAMLLSRKFLFVFLLCFALIGISNASQRLCGVCKVCTELARFALSHNVINNFMLLHCSSLIPSMVCLAAGDLLKNVLHSMSLAQICQLEQMCTRTGNKGFDERELNLSSLKSYDVDAINIMLSRIDSVDNFADLTTGLGPAIERAASTLATTFPLLKDFHITDDQRDSLTTLTNRFLMALDYKLRTSTGEGLREHLKPCKDQERLRN